MDPFSEFLSTLRFGELSASVLLGLGILMILTGRLVPKSSLDAWRDAYFKERDAGRIKDAQITDLTNAVQVTARALDALPTPGGEPDAATTAETRRRRTQG